MIVAYLNLLIARTVTGESATAVAARARPAPRRRLVAEGVTQTHAPGQSAAVLGRAERRGLDVVRSVGDDSVVAVVRASSSSMFSPSSSSSSSACPSLLCRRHRAARSLIAGFRESKRRVRALTSAPDALRRPQELVVRGELPGALQIGALLEQRHLAADHRAQGVAAIAPRKITEPAACRVTSAAASASATCPGGSALNAGMDRAIDTTSLACLLSISSPDLRAATYDTKIPATVSGCAAPRQPVALSRRLAGGR